MDELVYFGDAVKALGEGKVGGYLVRFSTAADPDRVRDFFTPATDFSVEFPARSPVYYAHGLDVKMGKRKIGRGDLKTDDAGVWIEAQLELRDEYERGIYAMAEKGKLGWSSGTASHLVERKQAGDAFEVTHWPLGLDASLTPTPAEPRNGVVALKSLLPAGDGGFFDDDDFSASLFAGESLIGRTEALCVGAAGLKGEYGRLREFATKEGRKLSNARRARVQTVRDSLGGLLAELDGLLTETEPAPKQPDPLSLEAVTFRREALARDIRRAELLAGA